MIFENQLALFCIFVAAGVIFGVVREMGAILRFMFGKSKIVTVVTDFVVFLSSGVFFMLASFLFANGAIRGFMVFAFVVGFAIERLTTGFLLAKQLEFVYNFFAKLAKKFSKTRLAKRLVK